MPILLEKNSTAQWQPDSWKNFQITQQLPYHDQDKLQHTLHELQHMPPLVTANEITQLKNSLAEAARGQRFLLQGGDCAERFSDCQQHIILQKIRVLLQTSFILSHGLHKPITLVGRIAGQFAKPRTEANEMRDNLSLPSYRGDLFNRTDFSQQARTADPTSLVQGYQHAVITLNYIRALQQEGLIKLLSAEHWDLNFLKDNWITDFEKLAKDFYEAFDHFHLLGESSFNMPFYISHEALHLPYEQAFTRQNSDGKWFNFSNHFPWCGMRTAFADSAHIEYLRGINNPVAIKVGPEMDAATLIRLIDILDPNKEPGRITLIHRLGVKHIESHLPVLIKAVKNVKRTVLWCCDPMHGNTFLTENGMRTRHFSSIMMELNKAFRIHAAHENYLGGIHLEMTGEFVTECIGGTQGPTLETLHKSYKTALDPRLNYFQALELAALVSQQHVKQNDAVMEFI